MREPRVSGNYAEEPRDKWAELPHVDSVFMEDFGQTVRVYCEEVDPVQLLDQPRDECSTQLVTCLVTLAFKLVCLLAHCLIDV